MENVVERNRVQDLYVAAWELSGASIDLASLMPEVATDY